VSDPNFKYPFKRNWVKIAKNDQWKFEFPNGFGASSKAKACRVTICSPDTAGHRCREGSDDPQNSKPTT